MIYARLHGRLGNQMFQYAAARALAERCGVGVALDTRGVLARGEGVLTRVFSLDLAKPERLPPMRNAAPFRYALWRYLGGQPKFQRERGLAFNPAFHTWGDDTYLHGYWQTDQYFADIANRIRSDFTFPDFSTPQNAEMAARIESSNAIALHVRRGDYLALGAHPLCDQAYYDAALEAIMQDVSPPATVFVFSDDPEWARDHLSVPMEKVVVDFNGPELDFEDMRLMSLCRHNVIANSSFSWWSAWLNTQAGQRVAAPAKWFGDPKLSNPDILPSNWLQI